MEWIPTSSEQSPFSGKHVDVEVDNEMAMRQYLDDDSHGVINLLCITGTTSLPDIISEIQLYSWQDPAYSRMFEGTIFLDPTQVMQKSVAWDLVNSWHHNLIEKFNETIMMQFDRIPETLNHEIAAIHVCISHDLVARVSIESSTKDCTVTIRTEPIDDMENALGAIITGAGSTEPTDSYTTMMQISKIMAIISDTLIDELGDKSQSEIRYTLPLGSTDMLKLSDNLPVPMPRAQDAPQIEQLTRPVGFDLLGGLGYPKGRLRQIANAFTDPENAARYDIKPSHFVLHGPPGTGKTSLVEAFAYEADAKLITVPSTDIIDKYVGESPRLLRDLFKDAYNNDERQVIFFDEFDTIGSARASNSAYVEVKRTLQQYILETTANHPNIIIAATMNSDLDDIEPALLRSGRLEPISVGKPNEVERNDIWACILSQALLRMEAVSDTNLIDMQPQPSFSLYDPAIDCSNLAKHSDGLTGADFEHVLNLARQRSYQQFLETGQDSQVTEASLVELLHTFQRR